MPPRRGLGFDDSVFTLMSRRRRLAVAHPKTVDQGRGQA